MTKRYLFTSLIVAATLFGCAKTDEDLEHFLELDSAHAAAYAVGGQDCDVKAKSVLEWERAHGAEYRALQKKLRDENKRHSKKFGETIAANAKIFMDATLACTSSEAYRAAMSGDSPP